MGTVRWVVAAATAFAVAAADAPATRAATVLRESGKVYIVDQRGEKWDVTQAESRGFDPRGFQYGIGRNAFTPLPVRIRQRRVRNREMGRRSGTNAR